MCASPLTCPQLMLFFAMAKKLVFPMVKQALQRGAGFAEPPERTLLGRPRRGYAQGARKHCKKPCEHVGLTTLHALTHFINHSPTPPICPRPEECICIPLIRRKLGPRRRLCNAALLCNLRPFACLFPVPRRELYVSPCCTAGCGQADQIGSALGWYRTECPLPKETTMSRRGLSIWLGSGSS